MPTTRGVTLDHDALSVGRFFSVDFQRTLRLPDDGRNYPLPPGLGRFPLRPVSEFSGSVPASWLASNAFLLPMHRHEALWLSFIGEDWHPVAVRVEAGGICALTGARDASRVRAKPQNYIVVPDQPWLDGIKAGNGIVRQFVAAPLGEGTTIEAQVGGDESVGGLKITVVQPKPGRFPDDPPRRHESLNEGAMSVCEAAPQAMGLGAGGRMVQKIYPDRHGLETWDASSAVTMHIHLVRADDWCRLTGEPAPPSPISVDDYRRLGLPWFELQDWEQLDLPVSPVLATVKPVAF